MASAAAVSATARPPPPYLQPSVKAFSDMRRQRIKVIYTQTPLGPNQRFEIIIPNQGSIAMDSMRLVFTLSVTQNGSSGATWSFPVSSILSRVQFSVGSSIVEDTQGYGLLASSTMLVNDDELELSTYQAVFLGNNLNYLPNAARQSLPQQFAIRVSPSVGLWGGTGLFPAFSMSKASLTFYLEDQNRFLEKTGGDATATYLINNVFLEYDQYFAPSLTAWTISNPWQSAYRAFWQRQYNLQASQQQGQFVIDGAYRSAVRLWVVLQAAANVTSMAALNKYINFESFSSNAINGSNDITFQLYLNGKTLYPDPLLSTYEVQKELFRAVPKVKRAYFQYYPGSANTYKVYVFNLTGDPTSLAGQPTSAQVSSLVLTYTSDTGLPAATIMSTFLEYDKVITASGNELSIQF